MQVFIMRHGDAALDAASDSVRPLTTHGCDESRLMANWLKGQKVEIERVLVRARSCEPSKHLKK